MPDHGSLRPIQVMPVPVKVRLAAAPASVERCALPPLWIPAVFVNQTPAYAMRASVSSTRWVPGVPVGAGVGVEVAEGAGVAVMVAEGVTVGVAAPPLVTSKASTQTH